MEKFKLYLFYIFTFGIGYLVLKKKAKEHAGTLREELTITKKVPFEIEELIEAVGGKDNIIQTQATINSLTFKLKEVESIQIKKIKDLGAKGTIAKEDGINCLFGDYSLTLKELIDAKLAK